MKTTITKKMILFLMLAIMATFTVSAEQSPTYYLFEYGAWHLCDTVQANFCSIEKEYKFMYLLILPDQQLDSSTYYALVVDTDVDSERFIISPQAGTGYFAIQTHGLVRSSHLELSGPPRLAGDSRRRSR